MRRLALLATALSAAALITVIVLVTAHSRRESAVYYSHLGYGLVRDGNYEQALRSFNIAIVKDPGSLRSWSGRSIALVGLNRHDDALKALDRVLSIAEEEGPYFRPLQAPAWTVKGRIYLDLERLDEAEDAFVRAMGLDPAYAEAWYYSALLHALEGEGDESLQRLKNAIALDPGLKKRTRGERAFKILWHNTEFNLLID